MYVVIKDISDMVCPRVSKHQHNFGFQTGNESRLIPRASAAELWEHKAEAQWIPAVPGQQKAST